MHPAEPTTDSASKSGSSNTQLSDVAAASSRGEEPEPEGAVKRLAGYPSGQKKAAHSNIYIRGLAEDVKEEVLARLVQPFGNIQSIRIYNAKKTLSFGVKCCFAFVKFGTVQEASAAIAGLDGTELSGNTIQVRFAVRDVEPSAAAATVQRPPASDNIYCKNLPASLREGELRQVFCAYGSVTSCRILRQGNATGLGGAALVRFLTVDEANRAVESLQGHRFPGSLHPLIIRFADSEEMKERKQANRQSTGEAPPPSPGDAGGTRQVAPPPSFEAAAGAGSSSKHAGGAVHAASSSAVDAASRELQQQAHGAAGSPRHAAEPGWHPLAQRPHAPPMRRGSTEAWEAGAESVLSSLTHPGYMDRVSTAYLPVPVDPTDPSRAYIQVPLQVPGSSSRPSSSFHVGHYGPMQHLHAGYMHMQAPIMAAVPTSSYYHQRIMAQPHSVHSIAQPWSLPHGSAAPQPGTQVLPTHLWTPSQGRRQEASGSAAQGSPQDQSGHGLYPVLVSNLPDRSNNSDNEHRLYLFECFAPFGAIFSVKMLRDKKGGRQRVGLVNFLDADGAARAVAAMDGFPASEQCCLAVSLCKAGPLAGGPIDDRLRVQ